MQTGRDFWSAALAKISEPWLTLLALASGLGVTCWAKQRLKGAARDQLILFFGVGSFQAGGGWDMLAPWASCCWIYRRKKQGRRSRRKKKFPRLKSLALNGGAL